MFRCRGDARLQYATAAAAAAAMLLVGACNYQRHAAGNDWQLAARGDARLV